MPVSSTTVTVTKSDYVRLTAAQEGYALIYNPLLPANATARLGIVVASTIPNADTQAVITLNTDEAFQRTSDFDNYFWGKLLSGDSVDVVVVE